MAGFSGIKEVIDAELDGKVRDYTWRKTPSQTTTAGLWFDLALSPGNPAPKYYFDAPPYIAKAICQGCLRATDAAGGKTSERGGSASGSQPLGCRCDDAADENLQLHADPVDGAHFPGG